MIHGLGGTSNTFQPLMGTLAGFRVIRPDMPGSGRSATPLEPLSIKWHAAAVLAALTEVGVRRAHFVGHSMGTFVCQHIAVTAAPCVTSLTLLGALTEPGDAARAELVARAGVARQFGMQGIADQIITGTLSAATKDENPAAVAFCAGEHSAPATGGIRPQPRGFGLGSRYRSATDQGTDAVGGGVG